MIEINICYFRNKRFEENYQADLSFHAAIIEKIKFGAQTARATGNQAFRAIFSKLT